MNCVKSFVVIAAAVACAALMFTMAHADIASPRAQWTTVRMESETVDITLGEKRVAVTAVFNMRNNGKTATVPIGYPLGVMEKSLNDFKFFVDDQEVKNVRTEEKKDAANSPKARFGGNEAKDAYRFEGPYKQWKVIDVAMAENEKKVIKVTYWVEPAQVKTAEKADVLHYVYTLKTGATWKGKIDEAVIRMKLDGVKSESIVQATPAGYQKADSGATLAWTFKDFKPAEDVEVTFLPATKK
jgi:hypothetical protein